MTKRRGFMDDLSSEAQSARAKRTRVARGALTDEQKRRQSSGNTSANGRKARSASPWNSGPMCSTKKAHKQFAKFKTDKR